MRAVAAVLVLMLGLIAGCGGGSSETVAPPPATTMPPGWAEYEGFEGTTLDGESIGLGDFRGRPVLVNVWSSW